jgi:putative ABC transport system permease protein
MAERYFSGLNPLGKNLRFSFENVQAEAEVVGVVANSHDEALTLRAEPELYFSFWQLPPGTKHLVVRTISDPARLTASVQQELRKLDPTVVIQNVKTFEQIRRDSIASQLFAMRLLVGFSFLAGAVALIGIYGVLSLSVASRQREMAIRIAVGAQRARVLGLVLGQGSKLVGLGVAIGIGVALALTWVLKAFLFGVAPTDPLTFGSVAVLFTAVALVACFIPARRATKVDPMIALRYE